MAANDPSDPTGGSGRRHPPVLDLSASAVEPRKTGTTGPTHDDPAETTTDASAPENAADAAAPDETSDNVKPDEAAAGPADATDEAEAAGEAGAGEGETTPRAFGAVPSVGARETSDDAVDAQATDTADTDAGADDGETPAGEPPVEDQPVAAAPPAEHRGGIGVGGAILAALIAAIVVVGASYIAIDAGLVSAPGADQRAAAPTDGSGLESRIADLESKVEAAGSGSTAASGALDTLSADLDDLKARVEGLGSGLPDRVASLESRVGELADAPPAVTADEVQTLRDGISQAAQAANQAATAAGEAATEAGKANAAIGPIQQSIESLRTAQSTLQSSLEQLSSTVTDLSGRVTQLETIVGGTGPREVAALALSTAVLDEQLRNGQPFGPALAAVKTRLEDPSLVAPLDAYAETGLPTRRELIAAFPGVETAIRDTVRGEAQADGLVAGLLANAESLVRVRRTDAPDDGGVNATLDLIRADLAKASLAAAADDWTKLPEPAQAASKDWHDQLVARVAADKLVDKVTADVLASLSEDPSAAPQSAPAETTAPGN